MPLPPLPDNNTGRAYLEYTWGAITHEICFRHADTASQADYIATATALANALKPYIGTSDRFTALRFSNDGSNLSFPLAWTAIAGTGSDPTNDHQRAAFVALSGRSSGGYRCRITFFTNYWGVSNDYRAPTTGTNAGAALYSAVTSATPVLVAKDGAGVIWNAYVNQGENAYWQRQFR